MDDKAKKGVSKFLSLVLRHRPELIGVELDSAGWVSIEVLLAQCQLHGHDISREILDEVVQTNAKQRFAVSDDGLRIRASQGHSVEVDLGYAPAVPPELLFHGTVADNVESIRSRGLLKMERHHVHLSADAATAQTVGGRRGKAVVLRIHAGRMQHAGFAFYLSDNGVWLTDEVPPEYIDF